MVPTNTVIVTPQIPIAYQNGGIGVFVGHFVRLLLAKGDDNITIVFTEPAQRPEEEWLPYYERNNVRVVSMRKEGLELPSGYPDRVRISELAAEAIPTDADVVYFADWCGNGLHTVRSRRFDTEESPVVVTVLHGNSEWTRQGMRLCPTSYGELCDDFWERYVVENSDYAISPSKYMIDWCVANHWPLPPRDKTRALGYPFVTTENSRADNVTSSNRFRKLIFFGRLETRKGFDLFVDALVSLKGKSCLESLETVVFLGMDGVHRFGACHAAAQLLEREIGVKVDCVNDLDSDDAQTFLCRNRSDSLVMIPSRSETAGFTVIECSLMPGLNMICSNAGGIPEVLGPDGGSQMFDPDLKSATRALQKWLVRDPARWSELATYDLEAANQRWISFHEEIVDVARRRNANRVAISSSRSDSSNGSNVDVCIPYYNLGKYLPALLESLERQTINGFNVIVVDDGSTEAFSQITFEKLRKCYEPRGWKFVTTENRGPGEARNYAASLGESEYICFVDADNLVAPNMVEKFSSSILQSLDDCLTCHMCAFEGDSTPFFGPLSASTPILKPPLYVYVPPGNCPEAGALENPFGDANFIIRRSVFEALGGFTSAFAFSTGTEDRELLTRLSLRGYKLDVIPEFLFYYRHREASRLRTADPYLSEIMVLRDYERALGQVRLHRLAPLIMGLKHLNNDLRAALRQMQSKLESAAFTTSIPATERADLFDELVENVHWRVLVRVFKAKIRRLFRIWRNGKRKLD